MIALDTNILVYARREETPHHERAKKLLKDFAEGESPWALPWPCIYEFIRVVTHPRVFDPPSQLDDVLNDLESLLQSPSLTLLREGPRHAVYMERLLKAGQATGNLAHDAHIAALVAEHGGSELWTADRDFSRFPGIRVHNPFSTRTD
ncbi:MAG: TA system VapC family ribonuclease toxin [Alphaproteobacteria bacterium]